jgi:hypothetical protein
MATMVNTVTGPVPVGALGRTLMHEHLFIAFHGAEYDPLAVFDRPAFIAEAVRRLGRGPLAETFWGYQETGGDIYLMGGGPRCLTVAVRRFLGVALDEIVCQIVAGAVHQRIARQKINEGDARCDAQGMQHALHKRLVDLAAVARQAHNNALVAY